MSAQPNRIVFTTEVKGLVSGSRSPREEREQREAMAVALAQPHRTGSDDRRLGTPLGRFCRRLRLRDELYDAGEQYCEIVRQAKAAKGFNVPGLAPGESDLGALTEEQIAAMREAAVLRLKKADEVLLAIMPRLPRAMERFAYDQLEPSLYDEDLIRHGLMKLAVSFGLLKLGINAEKVA